MAAFDDAIARGVDGLELDVRLSRDGVVVVHHDERLERTTDLRGPVPAFTADELARANAAQHFVSQVTGGNPFAGADVGVPTLAAVLGRHRDTRVIIELKLNLPELAQAVLAVVAAAGADERVCLGSFGRRVLRDVRQRTPHIATSAAREEVRWALYRSWARWPVSRVPYQGYQVPERSGATRVVSRRFVADAHAAGLRVQVWTVDEAADAERLLAWGVDALISDRPDRISRLVVGR